MAFPSMPTPVRSPSGASAARTSAALLAGLILVTLGVISCGTVRHTVMAPPDIPGATYVGSAACVDCHESIVKGFATATHARLEARGTNALASGCESCHGPGSLHSETGDVALILNPDKKPELCLACHLDVRGDFKLPHRHPLGDNRLTCGTCHASHHGPALRAGGTALLSANEGCLSCHNAQRGPHVFEHEALREGCTSCHAPHGSVNAKLLTERNATLCTKCHFQRQTAAGQVFIGGFNHSGFLARGTCWSAGCHEAVHGSQVNSSLRY